MCQYAGVLKLLWITLLAPWLALPHIGFCETRLEEMTTNADIIFKGQVTSSVAITNGSFPSWAKPHATRFRLLSSLKGKVETNEPALWHYTAGPMAWSGGHEPSRYQFETGQCYVVFAARLDRPDYLYTPPLDATSRTNEFRQLYRDGVTRALDGRPLVGVSVKEAHWLELNRLLTDAAPTNSLYAIQRLNMMSKSCLGSWGHSGDFTRDAVLRAVEPLVANADEEVAIAAIGCFQVGGHTGTFVGHGSGSVPILRGCSEVQPECIAEVSPHSPLLIEVANKSPSSQRRVAAIAAFACTRFPAVSNALPAWLRDPAEEVRAQAVLLLPDFPGGFSEQALKERVADDSAKVRSIVAAAIGNGKFEHLLPTLAKLFSEAVGPTNPVPPLTLENLEAGGQLLNVNVGDVHTSAGYALLNFDVDLVSDILKTNLNDVGFRPNFLCKLSEKNAGPWLGDLVEVLDKRRERNAKKAETSGVEPKVFYYQALMALSGTYYRCWNIIYEHLKGLPFAAFADGKLDRCLRELENAGSTGSREPLMLYELYRMKGLNKRAAEYRNDNEQRLAVYGIGQFFDKVDAKYPMNGAIPDQ